MAFSLLKVKNILNSRRNDRLAGSGSLEPEIGFKLVHNSGTKCLYVTVIGARHLPSLFGLSSAKGYLVKAKLFPGDAKFETQLQETSWPVWNEEFKFELGKKKGSLKNLTSSNSSDPLSQLNGHFISLTIYAVLETPPPKGENDKKKKLVKASSTPAPTTENNGTSAESQSSSKVSKFERILSETFKSSTKTQSLKATPDKRRTIGAATWNFDVKMFHNDMKYGVVGTPEIWRPIEQISSGLSNPDSLQDNKKGQVEVTLLYSNSENGSNDSIQITVQKMRCNIQTMQEQEQQRAPLYIKASISDKNFESHWKSERFQPTISARWDPKSSNAKLPVTRSTLSNVTVYVSLGCKNSMGVKEVLGKVMIGEKTSAAELWNSAIKSPGVPKTQWISLE